MSRQGLNRGRTSDKTKPPTNSAPTPSATHDIVAGKFNENDWNNMVEKETAEEFCLDIVEELAEKLMSAIYEKYIEKQLLPFTITQARNALTEIIEWEFLSRDHGEKACDLECMWSQDVEPEPVVTDCWAQGSVPKNYISPSTPLINIPEEVPEVVEDVKQELVKEDELRMSVNDNTEVVSVTEEDMTYQKEDHLLAVNITDATKVSDQKLKTKFRPYRGKLKPAKVNNVTETLDEAERKLYYSEIDLGQEPDKQPTSSFTMPASCASLLRAQNGRPPGSKEVTYDELGNVISVIKLDPEKLPTHRINVKYNVVDPATDVKPDTTKKTPSKIKMTRMLKRGSEIPDKGMNKSRIQLQNVLTPQAPSLIEEMELSRGVVVKEGGRVKKGPGLLYRKYDLLEDGQKDLKQINLKVTNPSFTVNDLLDRMTPVLRSFKDTSPLPPIVQPQKAQ